MSALPTLILLGEPRPNLEVEELEPKASNVTGRQRRQLQVRINHVDRTVRDALREELRHGSRPLEGGSPLLDTSGTAWQVTSQYSTSYGTDRPEDYTVSLEEYESLNLAAVEFGGLSLAVDQFKIDNAKGGFTCTVLVTLDESETAAFETFYVESDSTLSFFPTRLVGVLDTAEQMRFGAAYWEQRDQGATRRVFTLVSKAVDESEDGGKVGFDFLMQPAMTRLKQRVVHASRSTDALITELQAAGVLDDAAVTRIKERAAERTWTDYKEFARADNVEDFFV